MCDDLVVSDISRTCDDDESRWCSLLDEVRVQCEKSERRIVQSSVCARALVCSFAPGLVCPYVYVGDACTDPSCGMMAAPPSPTADAVATRPLPL